MVPVDDAAMAAPMLALHHGLRGGQRLAEALRDVRGALRLAETLQDARGAGDEDPATLAGAWSLVAIGAA